MTSITFLSFYLSVHTLFDLHVQLLGFKVPEFEEENCRNLYCTTSFKDLILVPPLTPFNYHEWKLKMIAYLKSHELFDVSIGVVEMPKSDDAKSIWFNNRDRAYEAMCLAIPHRIHYLIDVVEFPSEIWSRLDKSFG